MYPQKAGMLKVINRAKRERKFVVAGGVDPSSQPDVYKEADALVLGEGEASIPLWLDSWRRGSAKGIFQTSQKPDVTLSAIPRFDLLRFGDYAHMSVQFSRGCPFMCEFCDIIELFGRVPRTKTPEQFVAELDCLYRLGFRGQVDVADDNFIGNKRNVKRMLVALKTWNKRRGNPFYFSTEASLNMADDRELLGLMRDAGFKYVFVGIETPDVDLLRLAKKHQNITGPIIQRVNTIYEFGIAVNGGFILGFDNEKPGSDQAIIQCIEDAGICKVQLALLTALPNTQLTRRLLREGRLLSRTGEPIVSLEKGLGPAEVCNQSDHLVSSLNFIPTRDRGEILREYANVLRTIHEPRRFMDRVLRTASKLRVQSSYHPPLKDFWRSLRAAVVLAVQMTRNPLTRSLFWRNVFHSLPLGLGHLEYVMRHMGLYLHLKRQSELVLTAIEEGSGLPMELVV
jgi:radical SAM superfamily enzyme YgiQ (UPF0313 family)